MIGRTHGPVYIVADHSKWGVVSNFEVASIGSDLKLIADEGLDERARAAMDARSIEILIASATPVRA
jgi:DeoR/GlpR family transcriptional regulator of sugar metabolism